MEPTYQNMNASFTYFDCYELQLGATFFFILFLISVAGHCFCSELRAMHRRSFWSWILPALGIRRTVLQALCKSSTFQPWSAGKRHLHSLNTRTDDQEEGTGGDGFIKLRAKRKQNDTKTNMTRIPWPHLSRTRAVIPDKDTADK